MSIDITSIKLEYIEKTLIVLKQHQEQLDKRIEELEQEKQQLEIMKMRG